MRDSGKALRQVGLASVCLVILWPTFAQAEKYELQTEVKWQSGERTWGRDYFSQVGFYSDYGQCLRDKKKIMIGRIIPAGWLITPGGGRNSAGTITGAKCVRLDMYPGTRD